MRTPPHLPARSRREHTDHVRRHPYGLHDVPAQTAPRGSLDFPAFPETVPTAFPETVPSADSYAEAEADVFVEQRLRDIREMSNQAIGSIDDLLTHTA
ncbi:hypothetical protein ACGFJC_04670 [Nonomuraea fuscirosea]|uniref:Uncharacterized protein n=1 Tax=Nonomuraea fuscirosea TaxID=1291556 RepID=A0A2T0N4E2_9ACTN|nr:hypothetical protein [Nonomuraea fuscirosea]PRX67251.1 hypothetical protein B0I32_1047 [Nonomuraea fuscirosea]